MWYILILRVCSVTEMKFRTLPWCKGSLQLHCQEALSDVMKQGASQTKLNCSITWFIKTHRGNQGEERWNMLTHWG